MGFTHILVYALYLYQYFYTKLKYWLGDQTPMTLIYIIKVTILSDLQQVLAVARYLIK